MAERIEQQEFNQPIIPPPTERGSERWRDVHDWTAVAAEVGFATGVAGLVVGTAGYVLFPEAVQPIVNGVLKTVLSSEGIKIGVAGAILLSGVGAVVCVKVPLGEQR